MNLLQVSASIKIGGWRLNIIHIGASFKIKVGASSIKSKVGARQSLRIKGERPSFKIGLKGPKLNSRSLETCQLNKCYIRFKGTNNQRSAPSVKIEKEQ